jgi:nitrogen fixation protein FixH
MNNMTASQSKRSLWPYAIAGYFAVAFTGIAIFITWAVRQNMDLVRSDYYEHEILFQKHLDAVNRTRPLARQIQVNYDLSARALRMHIPPAHLAQQFTGKIHLYRPSDARLDQHIHLRPATTGEQTIDAAQLAPGLWKVRLEWDANGESYLFEQTVLIGG